MGKTKKMAKSDLRIREQRPEVGDQLAFEFLGEICIANKKVTKDSPITGKSKDKEASEAVDPAQLSLPF